ncbi:potassium/sodium hyperpolarization-activated cyclic nucleotide-gated channel 2 [Danio aesculapii]|uniref:potassium/sodium hyperpolarization-activated cyclic nucleotide-gated channel 2 n=1 Tax=Danio aesculapii TaxID=1142201 RepID=UPI0024BF40AB|nr:potassium/sodium hyperpolarization-activated cyclic nucleotide-gated channel 2 [Danio aesculapii]
MNRVTQIRLTGLQKLVKEKRLVNEHDIKGEHGEGDKEKASWIIHPRSYFRHCYLVFMVILTFVNLITIPLDIAFSEDMHDSAHKYWVAFNVLSDILFCLDVGMNFCIGIFNENGEAILDPQKIKEDYLHSWFVPDLVAAFPVDIIIIIVEQFYITDTSSLLASKMVRILMFARFLSMIRLLRVPKLLRFCFALENVSDIRLEDVKKFLRLLFVLFMMAVIWHWDSCIQYFVAAIEGFPYDCWIVKNNLTHSSIGEKYRYASFRALKQMSWPFLEFPTRLEEQCMALISMVIGFFMFFVYMACLITTFGSLSGAGKNKMSQIQSSFLFSNRPLTLRQRITADCKWQIYKKNVLDVVSKRLRKDIMADICSNLVKKNAMFMSWDVNFSRAVLMCLNAELFSPGDVIIEKDTVADYMFFIDSGHVLVKGHHQQKEKKDGEHFGDISFLLGERQQISARALTTCSLFSLSLKDFEMIQKQFPQNVKKMRETAAEEKERDLEGNELEIQVTQPSTSSSV